VYSIDASAWIDGWTRVYPPDVMPTLWEKLEGLVASGKVIAPDEVLRELERGSDSLLKWARRHKAMFRGPDRATETILAEIVNRFPAFLPERAVDGIWADPHVIALAKEQSATVVTAEKIAPFNAKSPKIPNVCQAFGIECIGLLELIRREGWRW
jgi:hypothetical protein